MTAEICRPKVQVRWTFRPSGRYRRCVRSAHRCVPKRVRKFLLKRGKIKDGWEILAPMLGRSNFDPFCPAVCVCLLCCRHMGRVMRACRVAALLLFVPPSANLLVAPGIIPCLLPSLLPYQHFLLVSHTAVRCTCPPPSLFGQDYNQSLRRTHAD